MGGGTQIEEMTQSTWDFEVFVANITRTDKERPPKMLRNKYTREHDGLLMRMLVLATDEGALINAVFCPKCLFGGG